MLVKVYGSAVFGVEATTITIEVNVATGIAYHLVGLPDNAVKESSYRITAALQNTGYKFPGKKIIVNMAPADLRKEGSAYDLTFALGILTASSQIKADNISEYLIMGELSLDGSLQPIKGALPIAIKAREEGFKGFILPKQNAKEAAVVNGIKIYGVDNILEVIRFFDKEEPLETTKIHSVVGRIRENVGLMSQRPFRSTHHTISDVALVGGGAYPQPGEISLSHNGVLFLDELPEFKRGVLEVMRQPLEDREVTVSRAKFTVTYPSSFMLVASMNPSPSGYFNDPDSPVTSSPAEMQRYLIKISGPLLDRIDIHIEVTPVPFEKLSEERRGESSVDIRKRVTAAREIQTQRFKENPNVHYNAQMSVKQIREFCDLDEASKQLLKTAMEQLNLSARAYDRILKVSRSIADLEQSENIAASHISEAIQYRSLDRDGWLG
ncbi:YifB family Mg chelatase-like AAA ATPase [Salegentibacter flavus]|uniref:Mg chelatase-related protein n=1 Tax=Salegentibacter flavus TaxID=287099 RepID=A0A1I5ABV5_9FLAO|nr:YifB family Mg chelatase-like AAA ATPase [Salegentibacter flavus]SFN59679.1 Mg chelatase-related protein [Salegentibacter flavus]